MAEGKPHTLSPSAWNRFETCPRMYWLSRQRLPRKAGMAASLGTAVHASIEDLLQVDIAGRKSGETHWLPEMAEKFLKQRWEEEKEKKSREAAVGGGERGDVLCREEVEEERGRVCIP